MSDIQPGDVVVGIDENLCPYKHRRDGPWAPSGRTHRVDAVDYRLTKFNAPVIYIDGCGHIAWCAGCFRKINDEPDDVALIARIKGRRPVKVDAPEREDA